MPERMYVIIWRDWFTTVHASSREDALQQSLIDFGDYGATANNIGEASISYDDAKKVETD